jgi:hypothetical protein
MCTHLVRRRHSISAQTISFVCVVTTVGAIHVDILEILALFENRKSEG